MIPRQPKRGIDDYVDRGVPTGDFLYAVLSNDLFGAFGKADQYNQAALCDVCRYVHDYTPAACHGSPERVAAWLASHRESPDRVERYVNYDAERRRTYYEREKGDD